MLNIERNILDDFIDRHGAESTLEEMRSLFKEKINDPKRSYAEREFMKTALASNTPGDLKEQMRALFEENGGAALIKALIRICNDLYSESDIYGDQRRAVRMKKALELSTVRQAWMK